MFEFLETIEPIYWIALALILGISVLVTSLDLLLWPALSALVVGISLYLYPGLLGSAQLLLFAALSIALAVFVRAWMPKFSGGRGNSASLNDPVSRAIGRKGKVIEANGADGKIEIDGVRWIARWETGAAALDQTVEVSGSDGMILLVHPNQDT